MSYPLERPSHDVPAEPAIRRRGRIAVVSGDRAYAESLRSSLAAEFDVLLARHVGDAAAKAQAVGIDLALVDISNPVMGMSALGRMKSLEPAPVTCAMVHAKAPKAQLQDEFDYTLARPSHPEDLPERIRFILAKSGRSFL